MVGLCVLPEERLGSLGARLKHTFARYTIYGRIAVIGQGWQDWQHKSAVLVHHLALLTELVYHSYVAASLHAPVNPDPPPIAPTARRRRPRPSGKCSVCAACSNCIDLSCQGGDPSHIFRCNLNNGGGDRGLSDLDHSNPWVQQKISDYLNSLVDVGVAGIRIDASKHINPDHLAVILGKVKAPGLYVNQETILTGDCQCVSRDMYYK